VSSPTAPGGTRALRNALARSGGTLAGALRDERELSGAATPPGPAQAAARGPRAQGHEAEYELLLEMIREGSLLHYGQPRVLRPVDPDLALLLGDQLYALGLSRLAALGDIEAVAELGDLISLIAQAHAAGDVELAESAWSAGAVAIGWGRSATEARDARLDVDDTLHTAFN
jgi:hypothetical protein